MQYLGHTHQTTYCRCGDKEVAPQAHVRATTGRGGQGQQLVEHLCMGVCVCGVMGACMCVGSGVCMRVCFVATKHPRGAIRVSPRF